MRLWLSRRIHSPNPIIVAPKICRETKGKDREAEEERGKKKEGENQSCAADRRGNEGPHISVYKLQLVTPKLLDRAKDGKSSINVFPEDRKVVCCVCEYVTNTLILARRKLWTVAWSLTVGFQFCFALSSHLGLIGLCFCVAVAGGEGELSGCSMSSRTPQPSLNPLGQALRLLSLRLTPGHMLGCVV